MSKPRASKKDNERTCVEVLKEMLTGFPAGVIDESECPDFLIKGPSGVLGIEVTRIHSKATIGNRLLKEQESEREAVVVKAQEIYETSKLPAVNVHVFFAGECGLSKKNRSAVASEIASLVAKYHPQDGKSYIWTNDYEGVPSSLDEVYSISMERLSHPVSGYWCVPGATFVPEHFIEHLQEEISKKEAKLKGYAAECYAHWLLVVIENSSGATMFAPSQGTLNHVYQSSFNRVFLLQLLPRALHELEHEAP